MSNEQQERPAPSQTPHLVTIVASRYNERYTNALVENCTDELSRILPNAKVRVIRVPGAFEIPVTVKTVCERSSGEAPAVVIALGVIIQGRTDHAELVGTAVTTALMDISLSSSIPVIHEVLLLDNEEQAEERCILPGINRGREAAGTATAMAELFSTRFKDL